MYNIAFQNQTKSKYFIVHNSQERSFHVNRTLVTNGKPNGANYQFRKQF